MAAYTPPTRAALRGEVAQDVRDPTLVTFTPAEIDDFVNEGIAELNEVRPIDSYEDFPVEVDDGAGGTTLNLGPYVPAELTEIFYVELQVPDYNALAINANDGYGSSRN